MLTLIQVAFAVFVTFDLVRYVVKRRYFRHYAVILHTRWPKIAAIAGQSLLVLALVLAAGFGLIELWPKVMGWSWLSLFSEPKDGPSGQNLMVAPIQIPYVGVLFLGLLAFNVPRLARAEEYQFRYRTRDWVQGVLRSFQFGIAHCIVGVPIGIGIALSIGGAWFTLQFFKGGIRRSALYHAIYNWTILGLFLAFLVYGYLR